VAQHFRKPEVNDEHSPPRYAIFEPKFEHTSSRLWIGRVAIGHGYGHVVSLLDTVMDRWCRYWTQLWTGGVAIGHSYGQVVSLLETVMDRWCRYWTQLWTGGVAIGHSYGQVVSLLDTVMLTCVGVC